jgi:hypothetical protein
MCATIPLNPHTSSGRVHGRGLDVRRSTPNAQIYFACNGKLTSKLTPHFYNEAMTAAGTEPRTRNYKILCRVAARRCGNDGVPDSPSGTELYHSEPATVLPFACSVGHVISDIINSKYMFLCVHADGSLLNKSI